MIDRGKRSEYPAAMLGAAVALFITLASSERLGAQELPPEIAKDMYVMQLAEALKAKDFGTSLRNIDRLKALDVELPETIDYFEGVASCETGDYGRCRKALTAYVTRVGADGRYYKRALPLLATAIEKVEAKQVEVAAVEDVSAPAPASEPAPAASRPAKTTVNVTSPVPVVPVVPVGALVSAGRCAIIVGSRKTFSEVQDFIREYPRRLSNWNLYQSPNGWIALSPYTILNEDTTAQLQKLKSRGDIPDDAFCTPGKTFVAQLDAGSGRVIRKTSGY